MNRKYLFSLATLIQSLLVTACGGQTQDTSGTGSKTNWFSRCDVTADCSELQDAICAERMCTRACERDRACSELGDEVVCVTSEEDEGGHCSPQTAGPEPGNGGGGGERPAGAGGAEGGASGGGTSNGGTGPGPTSETCIGPSSKPEQAYRCDIVPCDCSEDDGDEVVCVDDDEGGRHGFRCEGGVWRAQPHGVCATDESRCYSLTENVALALSGTIPGCECPDDDFGCGVEGSSKLPLECSNGRWAAQDGPPSCLGTASDLCSGIDIGGEFDEEEALYRGFLSLECGMGPEFLNGDRGVQLVLSRSDDLLSGRIWGVPAAQSVALTGSIEDERVQFEPLNLGWGGFYDWVDGLTLVEPTLDGARLTATASGTLSGTGGGDVIHECEASGMLSLERDRTPPVAFVSPDAEVSAFTQLELSFDEPVSREVEVSVSSGSIPVDVLLEPNSLAEDMVQNIRIEPYAAWPSGELVIHVEGAADAGGNASGALTFSLDVPPPVSVTENPSFEAFSDTTRPWLGCSIAPLVEYYDYSLDLSIEVLPSDGAQLAICRAIGLALQAFVVPPEGATRLLIDAGFFPLGEEENHLQLTWTCGDEQRELALLEPDDEGTPRLRTYAVDLAPGAENCWLRLIHNGATDEVGGALGAAFIDHLRFE